MTQFQPRFSCLSENTWNTVEFLVGSMTARCSGPVTAKQAPNHQPERTFSFSCAFDFCLFNTL